MQGSAKIKGLDSAMRAMQAAFPKDRKQQQRIINGAMGGSARKSFLPVAKQLALQSDSSGALSEALAVRAMGRRQRAGRVGGMVVTPVRSNRKAMAKYIAHYYASRGLNPPAKRIVQGIWHGHFVEFGTVNTPARPFLWPSTVATPSYTRLFAGEMKKRIESAVRRKAKKASKK